jgi:hypothetical protein
MMMRIAGWSCGALAGAASLWAIYTVFDPAALAEAQSVVLFVPTILAGAIVGDAWPDQPPLALLRWPEATAYLCRVVSK